MTSENPTPIEPEPESAPKTALSLPEQKLTESVLNTIKKRNTARKEKAKKAADSKERTPPQIVLVLRPENKYALYSKRFASIRPTKRLCPKLVVVLDIVHNLLHQRLLAGPNSSA